MLLVPTEVRASKIHGLGCFATKAIKKGTPVWEFSLFFDKIVEVASAEAILGQLQYVFLCTYAWTDDEYFMISGDQSRYINHADKPNCGQNPNEKEEDGRSFLDARYAVRNIAVDEELTEFYLSEEDDE